MPNQSFKHYVGRFAADAIHVACARTRTDLQEFVAFDPGIFKAALPEEDQHARNVVKSIATLSTVEQALLHRFDASQAE
eukprot:2564955-Karenia_brevis.AAC.1